MAPVVHELRRRGTEFECTLIATAQHRELLDRALLDFGLTADVDLGLMTPDQTIADFACRSLSGLAAPLKALRPDMVMVQGDTTTMLTAALASFYLGYRIAHVEAGLRSFDRRNPFPEEINRALVSHLCDLHFAPTARARDNLLDEGVSDADIFVTGNTIVDAVRSRDGDDRFDDPALEAIAAQDGRLLLASAHRRENHGAALLNNCEGIRRTVRALPDVRVVLPLHLNPNVRGTIEQALDAEERVHLVQAASYGDLLRLLRRCTLVLTDSGGIQEEAPSFGKPVLVMRDVTERQELLESGGGQLVGTDPARICTEALRLLNDPVAYARMAEAPNPFGDGNAAGRIVDVLATRL